MNDRSIRVRQLAGGWAVECALAGAPLMFLAAERAEAQARGLALLLASMGADVRVVVQGDRFQEIATARYFGDEGHENLPASLPPIVTCEG